VTEFGIATVATGAEPIVCATTRQLAAWSAAVLQCDADRALDAHPKPATRIRRIDRPERPPVYVVTARPGWSTSAKRLTDREGEVAELASRGYSALNIAQQLGLAEGTVRNHLKHIYRKLGVSSRVELARRMWGA
jgi:DNA-binding NarL/FixJ family response regulator